MTTSAPAIRSGSRDDAPGVVALIGRVFAEYGFVYDPAVEVPDLTDVQTRSYNRFLQLDVPYDKRTHTGLEGVLQEIFPIESYDKKISLEYIRYGRETPVILTTPGDFTFMRPPRRDGGEEMPVEVPVPQAPDGAGASGNRRPRRGASRASGTRAGPSACRRNARTAESFREIVAGASFPPRRPARSPGRPLPGRPMTPWAT